MKRILLIFVCFSLSFPCFAQARLDDFGRIVLNSFLPEDLNIHKEAKELLRTKLNQITTVNGMGGSIVNPRFVITVDINVINKEIVPGPPQMVAQNIDITLYISDAISNIKFSNTTMSLKGVGINENKAFIDAIKNINPNNKNILTLLEEGKTRIINYYSSQCDLIIYEAMSKVAQDRYDEAIYNLSLVPSVCETCYYRCLDTLAMIYKLKIDNDCRVKLVKAKGVWASSLSLVGAETVADILTTINPMASCQSEVNLLIKEIDKKLRDDEKARWQLKIRKYEDKIALQKEQMRIAEEESKRNDNYRENQAVRNHELDKIKEISYKEIALEYARKAL